MIRINCKFSTKKILVCTDEYPPKVWGGMSRSLETIVETIANYGYSIDVLTHIRSSAANQLHSIYDNNAYKVFWLKYPLLSAQKMWNTLDLNSYDVFYFNGRGFALLAQYIKHNYKQKSIIYSSRSNYYSEVKFGKCFFDEEKAKLQDILINNSDVIIVGNPEDKNELHDFYSKDLNIVILPNPINSSFISNSTELISERKNIFLFVGRFIRSKGILTIFQAIPKILNKYQDITFVFIGGHGDEDITEQLNLIGGNHPKNIIIQPWLSKIDLANFYLSAKAVVMPSLYEPFGNVAIECMASGSLLISTRIGGLNVITKNGKHALTIPLEDSTALALTIIDIAKNSKKYDGFALSGKDTVIRRFNPQKVVGEYMKYLLKGSYD